MRVLVIVLSLCVIAGVAAAQDIDQKPKQDPVTVPRVECAFENVWSVINFGPDNGDFTPQLCESAALPAWEWGTDASIPAPPAPYGPNVWGTVIGASYNNNTGDGLWSPSFVVEVGVNELVELVHYVDIETNYDGGNVVVVDGGGGETILQPMAGYPATISTSATFYAYCVDLEPGFTGHDQLWTASCADLSPWDGQEISIRFDFGSDTSVYYPGWYLAGITLGTDQSTPVGEESWGTIKGLYR
jgi:hypothetical protein